MTLERAIEILDPNHREHYESIEPVTEACEIGRKAIEKQIPKKPISDEWKRQKIKCPNGHNIPVIVRNSKMKYCPFCGQALDWSKE